MTTNWLPGATIVTATSDGGSMTGGGPKVTWHTTENDPNTTSALSIARYLNSVRSQVHIVWNPTSGQIIQMIPATRAGRGLMNSSTPGETNRAGTVNIQIEVVGRAVSPFTSGPMVGANKILAWLKSWGIAPVWPAGDLKPYPASYGGYRSSSAWSHGGHFGHSQVPENFHGDPGNLDQVKLVGYGTVVSPPSPIRPIPTPTPSTIMLTVGSRGPAVARVQKIVGATPDGVFGPNTKAKVMVWQTAHKVTANGIWDSKCEAVYTTPVVSTIVKKLQSAVRVTSDGHWGPGTQAALLAVINKNLKDVKYLQARVGSVQDGQWGPASEKARLNVIGGIQVALGVTPDHAWGPVTNTAFNTAYKTYYGK